MKNYAEILEEYDKGRYHIAPFRKVSPSFVATNYVDMSYSAGTPITNYYASSPMVFATLNGNEGIFKGDRGLDGAGSVPPSNTTINYSDGVVSSVVNASGTTTLNRTDGQLLSITFPDHTKTLTYVDGKIVGFIVS